jgi:nanoRNase/pAp phosphatase (c-di-AMP/oligoRNAs hydrolase)
VDPPTDGFSLIDHHAPVDLGETLLPQLAATFDGDGGGHPTRGGATLPVDTVTSVERAVIECVADQVGVSLGELS